MKTAITIAAVILAACASAAPLRMATEAALISATNAALSAAKNYTDAAVADIPEVDMSAVTNIAQEAAQTAQERAVASANANTISATNALSAALSAADAEISRDATNYTDAVAGQVRAAIPTDNAQLANGAGYVTKAVTNGLLAVETDPSVPSWAKGETPPLPPDYATVSNRAMTALQEHQPLTNYYTKSQVDSSLSAKADKADVAAAALAATNYTDEALSSLDSKRDILDLAVYEDGWDFSPWKAIIPGDYKIVPDANYGALVYYRSSPEEEWSEYEIGYGPAPSEDGEFMLSTTTEEFLRIIGVLVKSGLHPTGRLATTNDIPAVDLTDATNYTDEVAGELTTEIATKYPNASGNQLAQQVAAIGAHLNGEDARFVVTNYDSAVHTPEAYVEIKVSNNWLRVWDEGTRWNQYETWKTNVDAELTMKADRAWGVYDSETGGYSPAGFTQVSSSNILIASGMAYQRTVTSAGAVWVLQCNQGVAQLGGDTNGYFKIMDSDGNSQFEVVKGDRREMGCDASGISLDHSTTPNNVIIPYSVVSDEHPQLYITESLVTPDWKAETDADCIGTVTWTGSSGAYVATVHPKLAYPSMFIRATYMVGGETYIKNNAPVEMPYMYIGKTKYYTGTAVINGHTVLTLSTTAP